MHVQSSKVSELITTAGIDFGGIALGTPEAFSAL